MFSGILIYFFTEAVCVQATVVIFEPLLILTLCRMTSVVEYLNMFMNSL